MSTLRVELADLKPGVRYSFEQNDDPDIIIVEGTFDRFIPPSHQNSGNAQYFFSNVLEYRPDPKPNNPNNKEIFKSRSMRISNPGDYPQNISVYTSSKLPGELNEMINAYGIKSRKNRKSKRRNRKSKKNKKLRKSIRRRNKK